MGDDDLCLNVFLYLAYHPCHSIHSTHSTQNAMCVYIYIYNIYYFTYTYIIQRKFLAVPNSPSCGHESHLLWCDGHLLKTAGHMRSTLNQRPFHPKLQDLMEFSSRNGEEKNSDFLFGVVSLNADMSNLKSSHIDSRHISWQISVMARPILCRGNRKRSWNRSPG